MGNTILHSDLAGQKIGDYRLLRRLGSGGMADVYLAVQESLKRNVALKILKPHLASNEDYVERFKREAQAAAALVHANIVQIFEVGQAEGRHFIAQEYVRGRNLKQYLGRYGAVAPDMALSVLRQTTMALQKATERDVVHRDIKPENIMLTANGEIKIADFGLARIGNEPDKSLTQAGITVGTPLYMSPEQVEGGEIDIRSDIYSLGVTVYHMLVGEPPFDGDSPLAIAVKHTSHSPISLKRHRVDLPDELVGVVDAMLQKDPGARPQSPMQLLKSLQQVSVEQSEKFDWTLFEQQPGEIPDAAVAKKNLRLTETESLVGSKPRNRLWFHVLTAGVLSALALWGGVQTAKQFSGLKNKRVEEAPVVDQQTVPKKDSVEEQYVAAYWGSRELTEDDFEKKELLWLAVGEYFPVEDAVTEVNKTELYNLRAKCRLGEIYIQSAAAARVGSEDLKRNLDKASKVYEELSSQEDLDLEFRTTGLAGKAVVLSMRDPLFFEDGGQAEQESKIRLCLYAERGGVRENRDLLNKFMQKQVDSLLERYPNYGYSPTPNPKNLAPGNFSRRWRLALDARRQL